MTPYLNVAVEAARAGSKLLLQSMDRIDRLTITKKSDNDFVSNADTSSEFIIIETLQRYYPDIPILSEEIGKVAGKNNEFEWVIDPLDGTSNYLKQIPHFCVSIALKQFNKTVVAVVYDPVRDELFTSVKGQGALCNNNRIRARACKNLSSAYICLGGPKYKHSDHKNQYHLMASKIMQECSSIRRFGSAALDLCYLAAGRVDGYWGISLRTWDTAAAELILRESGILFTNFSGQSYKEQKGFLAATPKVLHELVEICQALDV